MAASLCDAVALKKLSKSAASFKDVAPRNRAGPSRITAPGSSIIHRRYHSTSIVTFAWSAAHTRHSHGLLRAYRLLHSSLSAQGSLPPLSRPFSISNRSRAAETEPPTYDSALATIRNLDASGTPHDLSTIVETVDGLLASEKLTEAEAKLLGSDEVFGIYTQALVKVLADSKSPIGDLVGVLRTKSEKRKDVLAASGWELEPDQPIGKTMGDPEFAPSLTASSNTETSSTPAPKPFSLSPQALINALFTRTGKTATIAPSIHEANQSVLSASRQASSSSSSPTSGSTGSTGSWAQDTSKNAPGAGVAGPEPIRVIVEEKKGSLLWRALRFLGVTAVYSFIMLTFLSLIMDGSGLLRATATGGQPTEFQPQGQKLVTFGDVHGCDEAKDELQEVVEFLKDPARFARLGGRLPRGVLLTGPPGTGKTLLARAVAGEAGVQFFIASGSEFDEMYVGVGARRIRELFAAARKAAPAIIFIDELDAIGSKRSPKDQHYIKQTLNQLLVELDGFQQSEGVILMAATNFPQSLDKALTRPGRFDRHVAVPLPDARGRIQILKHHSKNVTVGQDLDFTSVARGTPGFSGADLQNLVNQAAVKASREGAEIVNAKHFDWARDRIMMGAENRSYIATAEQKRHTAYHEAGHALVSIYTPGATPLHKVTCLRRGHALGLTHFLPELDKVSETFLEYRARLDVAMGGRAAEELLLGKENVTSGASSDIDSATRVATAMIRQMGFSEQLGPRAYREDEAVSAQTLTAIESEVRELVEAAERRAYGILENHRVELDRLAEALIEYETLDSEETKRVIRGERLSERAVLPLADTTVAADAAAV